MQNISDISEYEELLPCSGKLAFDNKIQAQAMATTTEYQRGNKLKPYRCKYCSLWHLSTDYEN